MITLSPEALGGELLDVFTLVTRSLRAELRRSDLPLSPALIRLLARLATSECSVGDLARHQGVSLPTMSKSITVLVRRGWVDRWIPDDDRRRTMVRLTPDGRQTVGRLKRGAIRHLARTLEQIPEAERGEVWRALAALKRAFSAQAAEPQAPPPAP